MKGKNKITGGLVSRKSQLPKHGEIVEFVEPKGVDTVPTLLQPGELVVNKSNVPKVLKLIKEYGVKIPGLESESSSDSSSESELEHTCSYKKGGVVSTCPCCDKEASKTKTKTKTKTKRKKSDRKSVGSSIGAHFSSMAPPLRIIGRPQLTGRAISTPIVLSEMGDIKRELHGIKEKIDLIPSVTPLVPPLFADKVLKGEEVSKPNAVLHDELQRQKHGKQLLPEESEYEYDEDIEVPEGYVPIGTVEYEGNEMPQVESEEEKEEKEVKIKQESAD